MAEQPEDNKAAYIPPKGTEHLAHLKIVYGRRFNPRTGKEESKPYIQTFTQSEYRLFANSATRLGYEILETLHKPF